MSRNCSSVLENIATIVAGAIGNLASAATGYPIPLGSLVLAIIIFYKVFNRNPFTLSDKELRDHIAKAVEIEDSCRKELNDLKRIKSRIERGELKIEDALSLDIRVAQLDECIKMAKVKRMIAEVIIMVRENIEVFKKLFSEKGFDKIISNVDELNKLVEKELKNHGVKEVDIEGLTEYIKNVFPLIIKEPEKFKSETPPVKPIQVETSEIVEAEDVEKLLKEGAPQQWIDLLKTLQSIGRKLKLPPGRHYTKKGYRNLLIALYSIDLDIDNLRNVLEDRVLLRIAEYLKKIKEGKAIEVDPTSSDLGYIDNVIQIICENKIGEEVENNTKTQIYEFLDANQEKVVIEKKIIKDPSTGKALKIVVKKR